MILITGAHKALALNKAIEEGVSHMWTVSAFQMHPHTIFVCDEDATLELKVKTVKYFKGLMSLHNKLVEEMEDPPFTSWSSSSDVFFWLNVFVFGCFNLLVWGMEK